MVKGSTVAEKSDDGGNDVEKAAELLLKCAEVRDHRFYNICTSTHLCIYLFIISFCLFNRTRTI
jgi:hypothetical protein